MQLILWGGLLASEYWVEGHYLQYSGFTHLIKQGGRRDTWYSGAPMIGTIHYIFSTIGHILVLLASGYRCTCNLRGVDAQTNHALPAHTHTPS